MLCKSSLSIIASYLYVLHPRTVAAFEEKLEAMFKVANLIHCWLYDPQNKACRVVMHCIIVHGRSQAGLVAHLSLNGTSGLQCTGARGICSHRFPRRHANCLRWCRWQDLVFQGEYAPGKTLRQNLPRSQW